MPFETIVAVVAVVAAMSVFALTLAGVAWYARDGQPSGGEVRRKPAE